MKIPSLIGAAILTTAMASWAQAGPVLNLQPVVFVSTFNQPVNGLFIDEYTFSPASFSGTVAVSLASTSGPVSFFTATLNGQNFSFFPETGAKTFDFQARVTADMPLTLTVFGAAIDANNMDIAGSYRGTVIASVPEPESYMLAMAGLLAVAGLSRRKGKLATH